MCVFFPLFRALFFSFVWNDCFFVYERRILVLSLYTGFWPSIIICKKKPHWLNDEKRVYIYIIRVYVGKGVFNMYNIYNTHITFTLYIRWEAISRRFQTIHFPLYSPCLVSFIRKPSANYLRRRQRRFIGDFFFWRVKSLFVL